MLGKRRSRSQSGATNQSRALRPRVTSARRRNGAARGGDDGDGHEEAAHTAPSGHTGAEEEEEDEDEGADEVDYEHTDDADERSVDAMLEDSETADEKRVRLTRLYLQSIRDGRHDTTTGRGRRAEQHSGGADDGSSSNGSSGAVSGRVEDQLEGESEDGDDSSADLEAAISHRLRADLDSQRGMRHTSSLASLIPRSPSVRSLRGHRLSVTCTALSHDDTVAFSGSKDGTIIQWDVESGQKRALWGGSGSGQSTGTAPVPAMAFSSGGERRRGVMALSASSDGRLLASAGQDGSIRVWDIRSRQPALGSRSTQAPAAATIAAASLRPNPPPALPAPSTARRLSCSPPPLWCEWSSAHRSAVSALSFRLGSCELFSASHDRTVKLFDAASKSYVETLFGHTAEVQDVHCLHRNRAVSVASDKTARLWKVVEESQLLFRVDSHSSHSSHSSVSVVGAGNGGGNFSDSDSNSHDSGDNENSSSLSLDCCRLLDDDHFLTGGDDGSVALWNINKKRPLHVHKRPHEGNWSELAMAPQHILHPSRGTRG